MCCTGEFVTIQPADEGEPPFVARLEQLFEERSTGLKQMLVRWLWRPRDLDSSVMEGVRAAKDEVFWSLQLDTQPVDVVVSHCWVLPAASYSSAKKGHGAPAPAGGVFLCTREFNYIKRRLLPIRMEVFDAGAMVQGQKQPAAALPPAPARSASPVPSGGNNHGKVHGRSRPDLARRLGSLLVELEAVVPSRYSSSQWAFVRDDWLSRTRSANTVREVVESAIQLEESLRLGYPPLSDIGRDRAGWRSRLRGLTGYVAVTGEIHKLRMDVGTALGVELPQPVEESMTPTATSLSDAAAAARGPAAKRSRVEEGPEVAAPAVPAVVFPRPAGVPGILHSNQAQQQQHETQLAIGAAPQAPNPTTVCLCSSWSAARNPADDTPFLLLPPMCKDETRRPLDASSGLLETPSEQPSLKPPSAAAAEAPATTPVDHRMAQDLLKTRADAERLIGDIRSLCRSTEDLAAIQGGFRGLHADLDLFK